MSPIHVSASFYLRLLCKIHVSGVMAQHLYICSQDPLQGLYLRIHISTFICISGSSARSMSPGSCLSIFASQDPLQNQCLRIHVSDLCLGIHQYGSFARSMSPDSCLSIFVSQDSLQYPCFRIHVAASANMDPLQDPRLRIHVSISLYLRLLCKIHVSGSVYMYPHVSQDPVQDPCLRIHASASICISGSSARSMSPDPYHPIFWPCAGETQILTSGDAFCVVLRRENSPAEIRGSVSHRRNANLTSGVAFIAALRKKKKSDRIFRAGETQILTWRDAFFVALRRRNANLTSRDAACVHIMWIHGESRPEERKSPRRYSETQKKFPTAVSCRRNWAPESRFLWPCAGKNEGDKNLYLDLRGFTLTVRTPQCATLFEGYSYNHRKKWFWGSFTAKPARLPKQIK